MVVCSMVLWCDVQKGTCGGLWSKLFTVQAISSRTSLEHNQPYVLSTYSTPQNHTADNNL